MKITVSNNYEFKFFIEYMKTFIDYKVFNNNDLMNFDFTFCDELICFQNGDWLDDNIIKKCKKIYIANTEQLCDSNAELKIKNQLKSFENRCKTIYGPEYKLIVYDYSLENCKILNSIGYETIYHPYNSCKEEIDFLSSLYNNTEKIYDIGFVGTLNLRRSEILSKLKNNNIKVMIINSYGNDRDLILAQCKYILNIHWQQHFNIFESIRCNRLLQSNFHVITETSIDLVEHPNLYVSDYDNLVDNIISILNSNKN